MGELRFHHCVGSNITELCVFCRDPAEARHDHTWNSNNAPFFVHRIRPGVQFSRNVERGCKLRSMDTVQI